MAATETFHREWISSGVRFITKKLVFATGNTGCSANCGTTIDFVISCRRSGTSATEAITTPSTKYAVVSGATAGGTYYLTVCMK